MVCLLYLFFYFEAKTKILKINVNNLYKFGQPAQNSSKLRVVGGNSVFQFAFCNFKWIPELIGISYKYYMFEETYICEFLKIKKSFMVSQLEVNAK